MHATFTARGLEIGGEDTTPTGSVYCFISFISLEIFSNDFVIAEDVDLAWREFSKQLLNLQ